MLCSACSCTIIKLRLTNEKYIHYTYNQGNKKKKTIDDTKDWYEILLILISNWKVLFLV